MNPFRLAVGVQCAVIASCLLYSLGQASAEQSLDYSRALGDAVTSSLQAGAQAAGSPRDKLLAWAGALHGALKPVADRARLSAGEVGTVGPKPWSPVPPSAFAMLPPFVGSVVNGSTLKFNSRCNRTTTVMGIPKQGSVELKFFVGSSKALLCEDLYLLGTVSQLTFHSVSSAGTHNVSVPVNNWPEGSAEWVETFGVRVFAFNQDAITAIVDLVSTVELFIPSETEGPAVPPASIPRTLAFMREYAMNPLPPSGLKSVTDVHPDDIPSGTILAILRLDGLAALEDWGTGAHTDHIAMAFRWDNGTLMVVESTDTTSYWTRPNIQMHTWEEWVPLALAADFNIMLLAPSEATQAAFDSQAAQAFIEKSTGLPYGYHNFLWGFVDTPSGNLPYPATWELLEVVFGVVSGFDSAIAKKMWEYAFNFHIGTQGLNTPQVALHAWKQLGMTMGEVMAVPEQDDWVYPDGPSMVCDVYACEIFKAGGVFGPLAQDIQCTEFNNKDLYSLALFNATYWEHVPACRDNSPTTDTCQLMGNYTITLDGFNSIQPYAGMNQRCAALPPAYERLPASC